MTIFARVRAREGNEADVAARRRELGPTRARGARQSSPSKPIAPWAIRACSTSTRGGRTKLPFEFHGELPCSVDLVARMGTLIEHPFEATRARPLA